MLTSACQCQRQVNLEKHGINFEATQRLWKVPYLLEIRVKSEGEPIIVAFYIAETTASFDERNAAIAELGSVIREIVESN